jgi:very-short-patch-repair endonuclease
MTDKPYFKHLHNGASGDTHRRAIELRHADTEAEKKLWELLRNRQLKGKKFRRQHAFANYILDFYCHECKLAIELDGKHHLEPETKEHDEIRTIFLEEYHISVLRFWNAEVMSDPESVLKRIGEYLK